MIRDEILRRIQPLVDQLAGALADTLLDRINTHINQLELAFDNAASLYLSDLEHTDGDPQPTDAPRDADRRLADDIRRRSVGAGRARRASEDPGREVREPEPAAEDRIAAAPRPVAGADHRAVGSDAGVPEVKKRAPNTCSKCGATGFTAQGCGRSHNVAAAIRAAPSSSTDLKPPHPERRTDGPAALRAAAERSALRKQALVERAASFVRRDRAPRSPDDDHRDDDEERARVVLEPEVVAALPALRTTFTI